MIEKQQIDSLLAGFSLHIADEKKLFAPEIKISIAYCDSLFEAGIFSRLESEKVKNALSTILKRAEFDKNYFDRSNAENIYKFIEEKLIHLIGELGQKIQIGRSYFDRSSAVLRLFLCEEIKEISNSIRSIQVVFIKLAETNESQVFITKSFGDSEQIMLFTHWCLAHFGVLGRDRERLEEVWRRVNTMPLGSNNGIGTSLEFNREELAKRLGFERITANSLYAVRNQDYLLEFANCASIIAIHLSHLIKELSFYKKLNYLNLDKTLDQENLDLIKGKLIKVFTNQLELQGNIQTHTLKYNKKFSGNTEAVIGIVEVLRNSLDILFFATQSMSVNKLKLNADLEKVMPNQSEIMDYLVQRNENVNIASENAKKVTCLLKTKESFEKTELTEFQKISANIEEDFFDEMKIDNTINSKNQIGGTSHERVSEALADAKRVLHFEE